ncbi:MAG: SRPBCC family protein [Limisphaerales bacterium]
MKNEQFVYVTCIRTTPEKLWQALTQPEFTQRYWLQTKQESDWKPGASWRMVNPEGKAINSGEIIEIDPPKKMVFTWRKETNPEIKAEGYSRVTYSLEPQGASVKLTILHEMDKSGSKLLQSVSNGWPLVLASLKSLIETGEPLEETRRWVACEAGQRTKA